MSLKLLENKGINLNQKETDLANLTAQQMIDKIKGFYIRHGKENTFLSDFAEGYFLELLASYPVSMCSYTMTEQLKLIVALVYFESKAEDNKTGPDDTWEGYSYDDLALIFDRSKATIHEAIKQKETEAKTILQEAQNRIQARIVANKQLIEEEKEKIRLENQIENKGVNK